jgi:cell division transport system permease protein
MLGLRSDLPLHRDASARFLPWLLGFMVYLAALSVAASLILERVTDRWQTGLTGHLTIEVPFSGDVGTGERAERLDRIIDLLSAEPGIAGTTLLGEREIARLLEPWLGPTAGELDIPLPAMIAVTLRPDAKIDSARLASDLKAVEEAASLDDHGAWTEDVLAFLGGLRLVAGLLTSLVLIATVLSVVFVTRTGLAIHLGVIEVVHLIGATDAYIAGQFQAQALRLGLIGGSAGTLCAVATLVGLDWMLASLAPRLSDMRDGGEGLSLDLGLLPWQWGVLVLLPLATSIVAMIASRVTVLRSLARLL